MKDKDTLRENPAIFAAIFATTSATEKYKATLKFYEDGLKFLAANNIGEAAGAFQVVGILLEECIKKATEENNPTALAFANVLKKKNEVHLTTYQDAIRQLNSPVAKAAQQVLGQRPLDAPAETGKEAIKQGNKASEQKDWTQAIIHYKRALKLFKIEFTKANNLDTALSQLTLARVYFNLASAYKAVSRNEDSFVEYMHANSAILQCTIVCKANPQALTEQQLESAKKFFGRNFQAINNMAVILGKDADFKQVAGAANTYRDMVRSEKAKKKKTPTSAVPTEPTSVTAKSSASQLTPPLVTTPVVPSAPVEIKPSDPVTTLPTSSNSNISCLKKAGAILIGSGLGFFAGNISGAVIGGIAATAWTERDTLTKLGSSCRKGNKNS